MRTRYLIVSSLIISLALPALTLAWTVPTASPPGNNVASPINTGATSQLKNGVLGVNGLGVFGDTILSGSGTDGTPPAYLNFGATAGINGYGIRNNAGILEFKNNGDSQWYTLQSIMFSYMGGGATWAYAGNGLDIYNKNTGNVGIGTNNPASPLTIQASGETTQAADDILFLDYTDSPVDIGFVGNRARGTASAPAPVQAGDILATFVGHSYNGTAFTAAGAGMRVVAESAASPSSAPTYLNFFTTPANSSAANERMHITGSGAVGIGANPNNLFPGWGWPYVGIQVPAGSDGFDIRHDSGGNLMNLWRETSPSGTFISFSAGSSSGSPIGVGSITTNGSTVAYNTSSDRRIKENIRNTSLGLPQLMQMPVRDFDFIKDPKHAKVTGFVAQELYGVFPEAVTTNGDNGTMPLGTSTPWSVDYGRVTPLLVKAVQEIASLSDTFKQTLIAWLGSTTNGITDLYASHVNAHDVTADTICAMKSNGTKICITGDQLAALLASQASGKSQ